MPRRPPKPNKEESTPQHQMASETEGAAEVKEENDDAEPPESPGSEDVDDEDYAPEPEVDVVRKRGRPPKHPKAEQSEGGGEKRKVGRPKHPDSSNVTCEVCGKVFKYRATMKQHQQIHFGIKEFECEVCHRMFLHKGTLKVHLRQHTGETPYKCPHCPKQFRSQTTLDCHVFRHTKQGTKCPQCPAVFATPSIVKQHVREVHTTEKVHTCQICGATYKHRKSVQMHVKNHQKRNCPDCGKVFHSVYAMMTHRKVHAQDHFQFKCAFCERKFEKEEELVAHTKLRGRTFQCDMCCHSFNKADYLANHNRRYHWKEKGLEQLKIAEPKNGWNRKGIKKPRKKRKGTVPEEVDAPAPPPPPEVPDYKREFQPEAEPWNGYNGHMVQLPYTVYTPPEPVPRFEANNAQMTAVQQQNIPLPVQELPELPPPEEVKPIIRMITTEIEPVLGTGNANFQPGTGPPAEEPESDHDGFVEDDFPQMDDEDYEDSTQGDQKLPEELVECKVEIKQELEQSAALPGEPPELGKPVKIEFQEPEEVYVTQEDDMEEALMLEEGSEMVPDEQQNSSDSESDDEIPLAALVPKKPRRGRPPKLPGSVPVKRKTKQQSVKTDLEDVSNDAASGDEETEDELDKPKKKRRRRRGEKGDDEGQKKKKPFKQMPCLFCGESFKGRTLLRQHRKEVHPEMKSNKGPLICELCGKTYANITSLIVHRSHHQEYQRFKCDECPKAFTFQCYLEIHKRAEHLKERLICSLCGKQFKYSQDLTVHMKQHQEEKPFKCDQCPSAFRYPTALRCHKIIHDKVVFTCSICNKTFRYANSLRVHKRIHTGIKRFQCEVCQREFATKAPLLRHMKHIHSVERETKCVVCSKSFYKKVELIIHQSKEHPNNPLIGKTVKLHVCTICGAEFIKKSNLTAHAYIHGDEYKYKCDLCEDQKFKQHAGLRHHLMHFHKLELKKRKPKPTAGEDNGEASGKGEKNKADCASTTMATLAPAVTVIHDGVEFIVQRIQCE